MIHKKKLKYLQNYNTQPVPQAPQVNLRDRQNNHINLVSKSLYNTKGDTVDSLKVTMTDEEGLQNAYAT